MDMDEKLQMLLEYLTQDEEGKKWDYIILSDASDVIANPGTKSDVMKAYKELVGHRDKMLIATEPTCWINCICPMALLDFMKRRLPRHFAPRPGMDRMQDFYKFINAGQHMASRKAMLHMLEFTTRIQALHRRGDEVPLPVDRELFPVPWGDQGVLTLYWLENPDRVVLDQDAVLFGSTKRFFTIEDDDGSGRR
eukprot:2650151-Amphidinium_carterae.1